MRERGEPVRPSGASDLHSHVVTNSPMVFVTLLSILVALDLSDLVTEARTHMRLWPLSFLAVRTWGQLLSNSAAALSVWLVFAHLGVTRRRLPRLSDSLCTFGPPLLILSATTFVGRPQLWPWLYGAGVYLLTCAVATLIMLKHLAEPGGGRTFEAMLRPLGPFWILYFICPLYLAAGWYEQNRGLPGYVQLFLVFAPVPASMVVVAPFLQEWRAALEAPGSRSA